jgi:lysosomal Pro-X carboxypeptidase
VYGNLAMATYPYANSFLAPVPAYPVREFCGRLDKKFKGKDLIDGLELALSVYSNYTGETKCLNINSAYDTSMSD